MKKSISKNDLVTLHNAMFAIKDNKMAKSFSYAIGRNLNKLKSELEVIQEVSKPSDEYMKYENTRLDICKKYAKKDDDGNPMFIRDSFIFPKETRQAALDKIEAHRNEHKEVIDASDKQREEIAALMKEEIEVDLFVISFNLFPAELSVAQIDAMSPIIKETEEEMLKLMDASDK